MRIDIFKNLFLSLPFFLPTYCMVHASDPIGRSDISSTVHLNAILQIKIPPEEGTVELSEATMKNIAQDKAADSTILADVANAGNRAAQYYLALHQKAFGSASAATKWLKDSANKDFGPAQFLLSEWYLEGKGVLKDKNRAMQLCEKAAENANVDAICKLRDDASKKFDDSQITKWFLEAAQLNNAIAQYEIGMRLLEGKGVDKNENLGFLWLKHAVDQDNIPARVAFAKCFADGTGTPQDTQEAADLFYVLAEDHNNADAQFWLANYFANREDKDLDQALDYYKKAADNGHAEAKKKLKALQPEKVEDKKLECASQKKEAKNEKQQSKSDTASPKGPKEFSEKELQEFYKLTKPENLKPFNKLEIIAETDPIAQYYVGLCHYDRKVRSCFCDYENSFKAFQKAAKQGHLEALYRVGYAHIEGETGQGKDKYEGLDALKEAAERKHIKANSYLGCYYFKQEEYEEAIPYLEVAAQANDINAIYFLGVCLFEGYGVEEKNFKKVVDLFRNASGIKHKNSKKMKEYLDKAQARLEIEEG